MNHKSKLGNYLLAVGAGMLIMFAISSFFSDDYKEFKEKIETLEKQRDSLKADTAKKLLMIEVLTDSIIKKEADLFKLKSKSDSIKNERNEIPDIILSFGDRELDSILSNYRHPDGN